MSLCCNGRIGRAIAAGLSLLCVAFISSSAVAQQTDATPKWDLFAGYQWLHPGATVPDPSGDPNNPTPLKLQDGSGAGAALTYNFDPHWGGEVDFGTNSLDHAYETTASIGPRYIWRTENANYFLHTLLSYNRLSVDGLNGSNGIGAILGGGMDLPIRKWLAFRLFEADYVWARHNYANFAAAEFPNLRRPSLEGARLRTGLVISWGGAPPVAPAASCSVQPAEVMVGEPVTATVTSSNFNPKHTVTYSWSANGGAVSGKDTTATIDTTNVAPGSYAVTAHVTDPKSKNNNMASCSANFTVKPLPPKNPPTMSCSVSPSSVKVGDSATITCSCTSPDGVSVSVANWNATGGTLSGAGSTAALSTAGASAGPVTISASCTDTRGLTGQASTQLMVENPPPPPVNPEVVRLEARLALHSIYFVTNFPSAANPKGGLLASQQKTLIELASDFKKYLESKPDAHLILGGHADHRGSAEFNQALSERRVARTKSFLIEQGVPEANIETKAFGKDHNLTEDEVKGEVDSNTELTAEERARVLRNIVTIRMASNRRVDVTLSTTGQTSVRQFPFNATDALTLIGGREAAKKPVAKKPVAKKPAPKK
ncbi:MAG TPA: OmpA family protein [Candidatus Sulfotelmatobacter sp.]|nr:OmpA family protein [Candidatus Sulfotelmatobacter sp.]